MNGKKQKISVQIDKVLEKNLFVVRMTQQKTDLITNEASIIGLVTNF